MIQQTSMIEGGPLADRRPPATSRGVAVAVPALAVLLALAMAAADALPPSGRVPVVRAENGALPAPGVVFAPTNYTVAAGQLFYLRVVVSGIASSVTWSADDGWIATVPVQGAVTMVTSPTHAFTTVGQHSVSVRVCNAGGCGVAHQVVTVVPPTPVAAFTVEPAGGTAGVTSFSLVDTSSGVITARFWYADDGWTYRPVGTGTTWPTAHVFATPGTHTITLWVADGNQWASVSHTVVVSGVPAPTLRPTQTPIDPATPGPVLTPVPRPSASPPGAPSIGSSTAPQGSSPAAGFAVVSDPVGVGTADALIDTSLGAITARSWSADAGAVLSSTSADEPTITCTTPGPHTVTLTVRGPGGSSTVSHTITATASAAVAAAPSPSPSHSPAGPTHHAAVTPSGGSARPVPWADWLAYLLALGALGILRRWRAGAASGGRRSWIGVAALTGGTVALLAGTDVGSHPVGALLALGLLGLGVAVSGLAALRALPARRAARALVVVLAALAATSAAAGDLPILMLALMGILVVEAMGAFRLDDPDDPWSVRPARRDGPVDPFAARDETPGDHRDASVRAGWADADEWAKDWAVRIGAPGAQQPGGLTDQPAHSGWSRPGR